MSKWRLQIQGGEYGPYSLEQLGQYAGEGRFAPGDLVRHDASQDWVEAGQVPEIAGLFSAGAGSGESATAAAPEPPPAPAAKKPRKKGLLRRPLFWVIFILLVLVYLGAVVATNLPYIYL